MITTHGILQLSSVADAVRAIRAAQANALVRRRAIEDL